MSLPASWQQTELGEILLSIVGGGTPSKSNPSYYEGDIPWMSVKDMNKNILHDTVDHISEEAVKSSSTNVIPAGTPIVATRMSLGKIIVANFDSAINQDLKALFLANGVNRDYLIGWYRSIARKIAELGTGTTVKGIRLEVLNSLEFLLPPIAEQEVIAEKLDTLLAQVDNTKVRLERIPEILKSFRQSVLTAAVSGKLTEEWRVGKSLEQLPNLNGKYAIDVEYLFEVPSEWKLTAIGNCATFQQGLQIAKATRRTDAADDVLPILRTVNYENGFSDDVHYAVVDDKSIIADPIDIIISRTGTVGRVLTGYRGIMHNNSFRINYDKSYLLREYLIYFLKSPTCQQFVKENSGRSSQPDLTHKAFAKCPLSLPSFLEQTEIVRRVERLFALADSIEQKANAALARVNNLTQSILAKAFRGELTADWRAANPDLISGDNSAEALLTKIKTERAKLSQTKKGRGKSFEN